MDKQSTDCSNYNSIVKQFTDKLIMWHYNMLDQILNAGVFIQHLMLVIKRNGYYIKPKILQEMLHIAA